jgi:hypothetical protein
LRLFIFFGLFVLLLLLFLYVGVRACVRACLRVCISLKTKLLICHENNFKTITRVPFDYHNTKLHVFLLPGYSCQAAVHLYLQNKMADKSLQSWTGQPLPNHMKANEALQSGVAGQYKVSADYQGKPQNAIAERIFQGPPPMNITQVYPHTGNIPIFQTVAEKYKKQ